MGDRVNASRTADARRAGDVDVDALVEVGDRARCGGELVAFSVSGVRWSTSLAALARREAVLVTLAVAAAIAALAGPLGVAC